MSREMVLEALQHNNIGQKMVAKWEYQKELWYRSKAVDVADAVSYLWISVTSATAGRCAWGKSHFPQRIFC